MAPKSKKPVVPADNVGAEASQGGETTKKRKASGEADEPYDETETAPKAKKKHRNTKQETSPQALTRLEKFGKDFSKDNEFNIDHSGQSKEALYKEWIEILSHHLVRETQFLDLMNNVPEPTSIFVSKKWLASIHLPRRYTTHVSWNNWYQKWWNGDKNRRLYVVQGAIDMLDAAVGISQTTIEKISIPPPPNDDVAQQLRQDTFIYHTLRNRMIVVIQDATDQEYMLVKRLFTSDKPVVQSATNSSNEVVDELKLLGEMKEELRLTLQGCQAESTGKSILDDLLRAIPNVPSKLFELHQPDESSEQEVSKEEIEAVEFGGQAEAEGGLSAGSQLTVQQKIDAIDQLFPFQVNFYGEEKLGATDMVWLVSGKAKYAVMDEGAKIDQVPATEDLSVVDQKVGAALVANAQELNKDRFRANMTHFEAIAVRDYRISGAKSTSGIFANPSLRIVLISDNLFHVKSLVAQLHRDGMVVGSDEELQTAMRRMWALVSVMHGCAPEGSLWLTVMDSLLEDLVHLLIGNASAKMHTAKMQRLEKFRAAGYNSAKVSSLAGKMSRSENEWLNKCDRARLVFAELARFYRGAVILAYASVSWRSKLTDEVGLGWYQNLIRWSYMCGADSCVEKLVANLASKKEIKTSSSDEMQEILAVDAEVSGGMSGTQKDIKTDPSDAMPEGALVADEDVLATESAVKKSDIGSRSKYNLSVGVKDARAGFPAERVSISTNRNWAYPCLYDLVHWTKWHAGYGPFFHYFAHLYHSPCQAARGKDTVTMQVLAGTKG